MLSVYRKRSEKYRFLKFGQYVRGVNFLFFGHDVIKCVQTLKRCGKVPYGDFSWNFFFGDISDLVEDVHEKIVYQIIFAEQFFPSFVQPCPY